MAKSLIARCQTHYDLNTQLSMLSDQELIRRFSENTSTQGWGVNQTLMLGSESVFVKRIPLTSIEHEHAFDTRNLFGLPMYYHYGVGSAGFGAFRELQVHIKTTNEVLSHRASCFPLLYHYRILPASTPWKQRSTESFDKHIAYWNDSTAVASYLKARATAPFEIALFLEHVPYALHDWFREFPAKNLTSLIQQTLEGLTHLKQMGTLHLDAHLANILTDGEHVFISDFGLALDQKFSLADEEKAFFDQHQSYDAAELLSCLSYLLFKHIEKQPAQEKAALYNRVGITDDTAHSVKLKKLLTCQSLPAPQELLDLMHKNQNTLLMMSRFFAALEKNKAVIFPEHLLKLSD